MDVVRIKMGRVKNVTETKNSLTPKRNGSVMDDLSQSLYQIKLIIQHNNVWGIISGNRTSQEHSAKWLPSILHVRTATIGAMIR